MGDEGGDVVRELGGLEVSLAGCRWEERVVVVLRGGNGEGN